MASKAAKLFEALIKQLAEERVTAAGCDLSPLLSQIKYGGNARTIDKLPLGTVMDLTLLLTKYDSELAEACPTEIRDGLRKLVTERNRTTHELAPDKMRGA